MATSIATLDEVKSFLDITGPANDTVLNMMMPGVLSAMGNFCNRSFPSATKTGIRDGNGAPRIQMTRYPITSVSQLVIDNVTIPQSTSPTVSGWWFTPGGRTLLLRGYTFTIGERNVSITYTGGYGDSGNASTDVEPWPEDLKLAFLEMMAAWFRRRKFQGLTSKSLAGESITVADNSSGSGAAGIPNEARIILENYVNVIPETRV